MRRPAPFIATIALITVGCATPDVGDLRESFTQQLAANKSVGNFQRSGDDLRFTGPAVASGVAQWRVHLDSAAIEPNSDPAKPYKGIVKSSWYADGQPIVPEGSASNLPPELIATGLAQECWALWNEAVRKWEWE
jgi:hypothetical protein